MPRRPTPQMFARAAAARAAGSTWEAVGRLVYRQAETVRDWPKVFPEEWQAAWDYARREVLDEATAEAVLTLRRQLRSDDEKSSRDAATKLMQYAAAARRKRGRPRPQPAADPTAAILEGLTDAEVERLLDDLAAARLRAAARAGEAVPE